LHPVFFLGIPAETLCAATRLIQLASEQNQGNANCPVNVRS
jgi:hypothetical protein